MALPTLLDIAKLNGTDSLVGLIEEVVRVSPELQNGYARTIKGLNYKTRVRTAYPTVGFRAANQGTATSKSTYENRLFECFLLNPMWDCDKAIADSYEDGAQIYIAMEGLGIMESAMITLSKQFYYGASAGGNGDVLGFPGLLDQVDASMIIDNTGSSQGNGTSTISTSVWAVRWGARDVSWIWGNEGSLVLSPVENVRLFDASNNPYPGYHQNILARPGLQSTSKWSCGRLKNVTSDASHGLTDGALAKLITQFPPEAQPQVLYMTVAAREQLRASRTVYSPTGAPAPTPTEYQGIPISVTNGILNTEAIA